MLRSSLEKLLVPAALLGLFVAAAAAGCGGGDAALDCTGDPCMICDAYGCHPANESAGGNSTTGGTAQGGTDTGGKGGSGGMGGTGGSGGSGGMAGAGGSGGGGGAGPCDPTKLTCPCADGSCTSDLQCVGGLCIQGCNFDYQCTGGDICDDGQCTVGCSDQKPCSAGYVCQKTVCKVNTSNPQCTDSAPCKSSEKCVGGICEVKCTSDAGCKSGEVCDGATGTCIHDPSVKPGCGPTSPCSGQGQECGADGYCHYPCTTVTDCQLIEVFYTHCTAGVCQTDQEADPACTLDKPCPSGQDCISSTCQ